MSIVILVEKNVHGNQMLVDEVITLQKYVSWNV